MPFSFGIGSTRDQRVKMNTNPCMFQASIGGEIGGDNGGNLNTHTILITDGVEIKDQFKYIPKD